MIKYYVNTIWECWEVYIIVFCHKITKEGDCYDIESCILFVGNFVPIHRGLGNFLDRNLLFIEDSRFWLLNRKVIGKSKGLFSTKLGGWMVRVDQLFFSKLKCLDLCFGKIRDAWVMELALKQWNQYSSVGTAQVLIQCSSARGARVVVKYA